MFVLLLVEKHTEKTNIKIPFFRSLQKVGSLKIQGSHMTATLQINDDLTEYDALL